MLLIGGGVLVVQLYIALIAHNSVDVWSMLLLSLVALHVAWFPWWQRRALRQRAYAG